MLGVCFKAWSKNIVPIVRQRIRMNSKDQQRAGSANESLMPHDLLPTPVLFALALIYQTDAEGRIS